MKKQEPLPDALPKEVVSQIWDEILSTYEPAIRDGVKSGLVQPRTPILLDFTQAAMEYPHFATSTDITKALNIGLGPANRLVHDTKLRARKERRT